MKNAIRVAGYCRVSTDNQAESGHSLDAQQRAIRDFCAHKGWDLVDIYVDAGISGSLDTRPALQRLLAHAEAGQFEVVVVHAIDRFYRSLAGLLRAIDRLGQHNVSFVSLTENLDFTTPWGKLSLAVLGTLAEIYIDKLRVETRKGLLERAKKGLHNGTIPLGYCRGNCSVCTAPNGKGYCPFFGGDDLGDGDTLIAHPVERFAIEFAFRWTAEERLSNGRVAERLNQTSVTVAGKTLPLRTKGSPGNSLPGPFGKDSVRELLKRVFYTGVVPYYGTNANGKKRKRGDATVLYPGKHPALVSQETFEQVQEIFRLYSKNPRKRRTTPARLYPLSGILYCGECGAKMRAQSGGKKNLHYYMCTTRLQHSGTCRQPAINAETAEAQMIAFLRALTVPDDWQNRLLRLWGEDPDEIIRRRTEIETRLARAGELYLAGVIDQAKFLAEQHAAEIAMADLQTANLSAIMNTKSQLNELQSRWETLTNLNKKRLLQRIVTKAFIRKHALFASKLSEHAYALKTVSLQEGYSFYSGSDGTVTPYKVTFSRTRLIHPDIRLL